MPAPWGVHRPPARVQRAGRVRQGSAGIGPVRRWVPQVQAPERANWPCCAGTGPRKLVGREIGRDKRGEVGEPCRDRARQVASIRGQSNPPTVPPADYSSSSSPSTSASTSARRRQRHSPQSQPQSPELSSSSPHDHIRRHQSPHDSAPPFPAQPPDHENDQAGSGEGRSGWRNPRNPRGRSCTS